jgi:hypothetical protein
MLPRGMQFVAVLRRSSGAVVLRRHGPGRLHLVCNACLANFSLKYLIFISFTGIWITSIFHLVLRGSVACVDSTISERSMNLTSVMVSLACSEVLCHLSTAGQFLFYFITFLIKNGSIDAYVLGYRHTAVYALIPPMQKVNATSIPRPAVYYIDYAMHCFLRVYKSPPYSCMWSQVSQLHQLKCTVAIFRLPTPKMPNIHEMPTSLVFRIILSSFVRSIRSLRRSAEQTLKTSLPAGTYALQSLSE